MDRGDAWPEDVPVQIHGKADDEFFAGEGDIDAARAIVAARPTAELFVYPGGGHLFADPASPGYDAVAAAELLGRVVAFLSER